MPKGYAGLLGRRHYPMSQQHLQRFAGGADGDMRTFLSPFAYQSHFFKLDHFAGDTIDSNLYTTGESGSGTAFAIPSGNSINGILTAITGSSSGNAETIRSEAVLAGDYNCWVEARIRLPSVANILLEFGLIDAASDYTIPAVSDIDTPSFAAGVGDAVVLHMDTSQTLTTMALATIGSSGTGYSAKATTVTLGVTSGTFTPTAGSFHTYRVGLEGDIPYALIDGKPIVNGVLTTSTTGKVEGGTLLKPWIAVRTRTAGAKTINVDYLVYMQDLAARTA